MTIKASYDPGQTNVDFFCRNATAQWWNGSAFEAYNAANIATYRIAATESPAGSGLYEATEPTGTVEFELRYRAATLADSYIVSGPATVGGDADAILTAFRSSADYGTADGGLVAEVNKIQRSATAVTPGAPQEKQLVDGAGNTLQTVHEKILGDA